MHFPSDSILAVIFLVEMLQFVSSQSRLLGPDQSTIVIPRVAIFGNNDQVNYYKEA